MGDPATTVTRFQLCVTTAIGGAKRRAECAQTVSCGERFTRELTEQMQRAACGTTQETYDKINALLFIPPNASALWLLSDALVPMPFSFDGNIPSTLVRALRQHAPINPDRAVLTAITSATEVRHAVGQKNVNISDTPTDFMGQVIATIDDNYKKIVDIGLLYRAKQFLEMLVETAAWPTLSRIALDSLARLQQFMDSKNIPPNPSPPPPNPPKPIAKSSDRAYALAAGGVAIVGAVTIALVRGFREPATPMGRVRARRAAFR